MHQSDAMREDRPLLAALLGDYLAAAGERANVADFLFGDAPIRILDEVFASDPALSIEAVQGRVWLMHLSGYFGGVWLRGEIRSAQPENVLMAAGAPPTRDGFLQVAGRAVAALQASTAEPDVLREHLETALPELITGFGYNRGYLLQILEAPPDGIRADTGAIVPDGPLWCRYRNGRLAALERLEPAAQKLASSAAGWEAQAEAIPIKQAEAEKNGRAVWSTGLSVKGFRADAYTQLVALSSSFLEVTQAVALAALACLCDDDIPLGRRAALALACLVSWTGSYGMGLMDPRPDGRPRADALPRIVS